MLSKLTIKYVTCYIWCCFSYQKKKKNPRMYFFHIFEKIAQFNIMLNY